MQTDNEVCEGERWGELEREMRRGGGEMRGERGSNSRPGGWRRDGSDTLGWRLPAEQGGTFRCCINSTPHGHRPDRWETKGLDTWPQEDQQTRGWAGPTWPPPSFSWRPDAPRPTGERSPADVEGVCSHIWKRMRMMDLFSCLSLLFFSLCPAGKSQTLLHLT